jgi:ribosomal protein S12 methylthiotransferase RimO
VSQTRTVSVVTLGCARNEVDSEELAGRLAADGWRLVEDADDAEVVLVNTCGFVEAAKKDSIDTLLAAAELKQQGTATAVVAVGCLAERYGERLAAALPEADAVLGFDDYADISARLRAIAAGERHVSHVPRDRRSLLPIAPAARAAASGGDSPARTAASRVDSAGRTAASKDASAADDRIHSPWISSPRLRLAGGPVAPVKLATGCDRRCSFCAIPTFRGAFVSRRPAEIRSEAWWLAGTGVRELVLVSENSTSYGKDLGDLRLLETLLPELAAIDEIERVRVSYLQPAELRAGLIDVIAGTAGVAPYFDLSFQHASGAVLRRMRRFGDSARFLQLLDRIRQRCPQAGVRSNFIVGFPGETEADHAELERFLTEARLDAIGVFGYSDEDGTEAAGFAGKLDARLIADRVARLTLLAEELTAQRAEERIGEIVEVLVEETGYDGEDSEFDGRAAHQAPEVDGSTFLRPPHDPGAGDRWSEIRVGSMVSARVVATSGVDVIAEVIADSRDPDRTPAGPAR